ncbi:NAD(+) diphosphatase [Saliniradius amylolyticus]|uniref:NAD(+) diphosphatase n=1 Tax=Saliniradius amylolyticus TaxID=2183582 RepID=A0A2S2E6H6_9ALTE|nr:NAD(+) diphosphatase [Saliniradius amylolyticus]AWL13266.1 NAD(+) diphosphatase [Saliniradius amylolyticus]
MFQLPEPNQDAFWFIFSGKTLLQLRHQPGMLQAQWQELTFLHHYADRVLPLEPHQDTPCYIVDMGLEQPDQDLLESVSLRQALMAEPKEAFGVMARAWQLTHFYRTHRYCGQCGQAMTPVNWEYAMHCHQCQHRCYPRVSPCVIVAITKGEQLLLAQGGRHKDGMMSVLAGFVESGESLEQAVHREVMEEVGIEITNLNYFHSQPWPFPHSLMMGFTAEHAGGEIRVDGEEILHADWYDMDDLPNTPPKLSIAGRLIEHVVNRNVQTGT